MPAMLPREITSVKVCRWRLRDDTPDDFHARYVLTDRGCCWLDKGLDKERGRKQRVTLLSDRTRQQLWDGYTGATPFMDKEGEFTVSATPPPPAAGGRRR